ncbi:hypothetical protein J2Y58_003800 [Sphingomonas sp. BE138]|uniref:hypothetical protein n=1 Tax=Sphingomonas sp. BE138 TaxID=2817845 RepID=UPI002863F5D4|nr:hypothetical protein [Sphingomonas sp. BE138]MDR6790417.1 hypothetical protein [Sphingomonas sp. BE138]
MFDRQREFAFASRRARQEEIAAINARGAAAAAVHHELARLYATRAMSALHGGDRAILSPHAAATPGPEFTLC